VLLLFSGDALSVFWNVTKSPSLTILKVNL